MSGVPLAGAVLAVHLAVIAFNIFGLVVIPLGAWLGWRFIRAPLWRWAHVASLGVVALQALAGRACFLTLWQSALSGGGESAPLIMRAVNSVVFWPLPAWLFVALYLAAFAWTVAWLWLAPPRPWRRE